MGAQQYLIKDQESFYDNSLKTMLKSADKFYLQKHFLIGEKVNYDKLRHAQLLEEILCTDSCELIDYIYKKVAGTLETKRSRKVSKLQKALDREEDERTIIINNFNVEQIWQDVKW